MTSASSDVSRQDAGRGAVLVVDDVEANLTAMSALLSGLNCDIVLARSGNEALRHLLKREFAVMLLDVQMPEMDGYTLAAELRQRAGSAGLPLLVLTSVGAVPARPDLRLAQTLSKPVKSQTLFEALSGLFSESQTGGAPAAPASPDTRPRLAHEIPLALLLAEDNVMNQRVAALLLNGLGYELGVVGDGQAALHQVAAARAVGRPLDVVFLDVQMPVLDGLETARQLRTLYPDAAQRPWIVAMTANAMQGDRELCIEAGMDDYLSKPIRAQAVAEALRRAAAGLGARRGA